jgi:hypothetical protein
MTTLELSLEELAAWEKARAGQYSEIQLAPVPLLTGPA